MCRELQKHLERSKTSLKSPLETTDFSQPAFTEMNFLFTSGSTTAVMNRCIQKKGRNVYQTAMGQICG